MSWQAVGMVTGLLFLGAGCTSASFGGAGRREPPAALLDRADMVTLPPGGFRMGYAHGDPDEHPPHQVELPGFLIDRQEVSNDAYGACVRAGVCRAAAHAGDPVLGAPTHPVVGVTWFDAKRYCGWLGKRLPTEAEWEYAARYPKFLPFPWEGKAAPQLANLRGAADGHRRTAPVGTYPAGASGAGALDMAGNAAEWTADWYDSEYYKESPQKAPTGPSTSTGARSVRGGSWGDTDYEARATRRTALSPNFARDSVGFRCAAAGRSVGPG